MVDGIQVWKPLCMTFKIYQFFWVSFSSLHALCNLQMHNDNVRLHKCRNPNTQIQKCQFPNHSHLPLCGRGRCTLGGHCPVPSHKNQASIRGFDSRAGPGQRGVDRHFTTQQRWKLPTLPTLQFSKESCFLGGMVMVVAPCTAVRPLEGETNAPATLVHPLQSDAVALVSAIRRGPWQRFKSDFSWISGISLAPLPSLSVVQDNHSIFAIQHPKKYSMNNEYLWYCTGNQPPWSCCGRDRCCKEIDPRELHTHRPACSSWDDHDDG